MPDLNLACGEFQLELFVYFRFSFQLYLVFRIADHVRADYASGPSWTIILSAQKEGG